MGVEGINIHEKYIHINPGEDFTLIMPHGEVFINCSPDGNVYFVNETNNYYQDDRDLKCVAFPTREGTWIVEKDGDPNEIIKEE